MTINKFKHYIPTKMPAEFSAQAACNLRLNENAWVKY
jgi:hypothetical protein